MTFAWCTLVMLNEAYALGAVVMACSLRTVQTAYPIWCMVTPDISGQTRAFLSRHFDMLIEVPLLTKSCVRMRSRKQNDIYGGWVQSSFTKWNALNPNLMPAKKVILIDADMIFLKKCDQLFDLEAPALTFSSPWSRSYIGRLGTPDAYGMIQHGSVVNHKSIKKGFKGGFLGLGCMVLLAPDSKLFNKVSEILALDGEYGNSSCTSGFDEQLLADVLLSCGITIRHIHQRYNWIVGKHSWLPEGSPYTMQFYNTKPWVGITSLAERLEKSQYFWQDVVAWWRIADTVMETDKRAFEFFYPKNEKQHSNMVLDENTPRV